MESHKFIKTKASRANIGSIGFMTIRIVHCPQDGDNASAGGENSEQAPPRNTSAQRPISVVQTTGPNWAEQQLMMI